VVTLRHKLARVLIVAIPRGLRTCKRSRVAVSSSLEIEDSVDSVCAAADSDHNRILVRTHDVCDAIEHRFPLKGLVMRDHYNMAPHVIQAESSLSLLTSEEITLWISDMRAVRCASASPRSSSASRRCSSIFTIQASCLATRASKD
jgi:hypothetical protein